MDYGEILKSISSPRPRFESKGNTVTSTDKIARETQRILRLSSYWDQTGNVFTDFRQETNERIRLTIRQSKIESDEILKKALFLESQVLGITGKGAFSSIEEYIGFLHQNGRLRDFEYNSVDLIPTAALTGLKSGLVSHWRIVATQIEHGINGIYSWQDFLSNSDTRQTRWYTVSYYDEREAWRWDMQKGIEIDEVKKQKDVFSSNWVFHTVNTSFFDSILEAHELNSVENNLSASRVVWKGSDNHLSFLFDIRDLVNAIPLIHGDYYLEREIKSVFPVSIRLCRAIIPVGVLNRHKGIRSTSEGWVYKEIDPSKIKPIS